MGSKLRWSAIHRYVEKGLCYKQQDVGALQHHIEVVEDTQFLRQQLPGLGLVAFVGNGAILPRQALSS